MANSPTGARQWRLDEPQRKPPNPHMFDLPKKPDIELLLLQLDDKDLEIPQFAERLTRFPGLNRYMLATVNYRLSGKQKEQRINDSSHASALLGISGLHRLLEPLLEHEPRSSLAG